MRIALLPVVYLFLLCLPAFHASAQEDAVVVPISGRITAGDERLEGCEVVIFRHNELVEQFSTGKSGKYSVSLPLNALFSLEFRRTGYVPKRVQIDTHFPGATEDVYFEPLLIDIGLLPESKYKGVSTDELDYPFAFIRYNEREEAFMDDQEWSVDMQRTNGALLLMASRVERRAQD